jgi:hypothetical protein
LNALRNFEVSNERDDLHHAPRNTSLREYYGVLVSRRREDVLQLRALLSRGNDVYVRGMGGSDTLMVISACRKCGKLVEMTTEEAYTPWWQCAWYDRMCHDCWKDLVLRRTEIDNIKLHGNDATERSNPSSVH